MQRVRERIRRFACSPVPILILGETGTGKELVAEAIFRLSGMAPFVPVNCAAIPEPLADTELFGHERGAFTGALQSRIGLVAEAHGGTLFLDELADLPLTIQSKLLRTLESGEYRPVGSSTTKRACFRILAATSDCFVSVSKLPSLRRDFIHRVDAIRIQLPALRDRVEDIPLIAQHLLSRFRERAGVAPAAFSIAAITLLAQQEWQGNVRELRNVVEASAASAGGAETIGYHEVLECLHGTVGATSDSTTKVSLARVRKHAEQSAIADALRQEGGNKQRAARRLGISQATLYRKMGPAEVVLDPLRRSHGGAPKTGSVQNGGDSSL
jgi:DNA-binding NtrC family response regulator